MAKITFADLASLGNASSAVNTINNNYTSLETALDKVVWRDGTTPNAMEADFDMGDHKVLNVKDPEADADAVNLRSVRPLVEEYVGEIAETIIAGTLRIKRFEATAGQSDFVLDSSPGTAENAFVFDTGIMMYPGVDYTLTGVDMNTITFLAGRSDGAEIVVRYIELAPSDGALRADLNRFIDGYGADLVRYDEDTTVGEYLAKLGQWGAGFGADLIGFQHTATGVAKRTALAKLRETISPEDFGAIGDGTDRPVSQWLVGGVLDRGYADLAAIQVDYPHVTALTESIDWAGFQSAINHAQTTGKRLRANGDYKHNRGLNVTAPIYLDGGGWGESGAVTSPAFTAGCRITATAAIAAILYISPTANPGALHGVRVENMILDGNNLAQRILQADSLTRSIFQNIEGIRATIVGFDFTDLKGYYFYKNYLNALRYNSTASVAAQNSDGFWFRDTIVAAGGIVQNHIGWLESFTVNGDGVVVGGADNNEFGSITANTSTGTGVGLRWLGPLGFGTLQPRNNFVRYMGGTVVDETNSRTNVIFNMSSEATSITRTGTLGETLPRIFNYVTGKYWSIPDYRMRDVMQFGVGQLQNISGTEGVLQSLWPTISLADAATQAFGLSVGMPYDWHNGTIKQITLYFAMTTSLAGNLRMRIRMATPADGVGTGTPAIDESFTIAADPTVGFIQKVTLTLTTPMSVTHGDLILLRAERVGADAADTHTGTMDIQGLALHYTSDGPSADGGGGGPWQIRDPSI